MIRLPRLPTLLVLMALAGCGATVRNSPPREGVDPYFHAETLAGHRASPADPVEATEDADYAVKVIFRPSDPNAPRLSTPVLTLVKDRPAGLLLANEMSFVRSVCMLSMSDTGIIEPEVGKIMDGLMVDLAARPGSDARHVRLAYHIRLSAIRRPIEVRSAGFTSWTTFQIPKTDHREARGVQELALGAMTRIARLPSADGRGWDDVLIRVEAAPARGAPPGSGALGVLGDPEAPDELLRLLDTSTVGGGQLRLEAVLLAADLPVGVPLLGGAADAYRDRIVTRLRRFVLVSAPAEGASIRGQLREAYVSDYERASAEEEAAAGRRAAEIPHIWRPVLVDLVSGLDASYEGESELRISWSFSPRWELMQTTLENGMLVPVDIPEITRHEWRGALREGRSLVPLARLKGGGTAAVLVELGRR